MEEEKEREEGQGASEEHTSETETETRENDNVEVRESEESKEEVKEGVVKEDKKTPEIKEEKKKDIKKDIINEKKERKFNSALYDGNYKKLLFVSLAILVIALVYLAVFTISTGDIMRKDVSLTGGTTITVFTEADTQDLTEFLETKLGEVNVRALQDITSRKQIAVVVETSSGVDEARAALGAFLGFQLTEENSSTEITGTLLSRSFYKQFILALIAAFILMIIVVFIIFRNAVSSLAVILAAFTDLVVTLALVNLLGFQVSIASIAAFLMLIGYSVDTDLMLTTRVLKRREDKLNTRMNKAFKTGLTMTLTSLVAVFVGFLVIQAPVLRQIFLVLTIGLAVDLIATWFGNASIIKWYCEKKGIN